MLYNLGSYYETHFPGFVKLRTKALELLRQESDLKELTQLIGYNSLAETDKMMLEVVKLLTEDFLHQNGLSSQDRCCPFYKTYGMLRNIVKFHELGSRLMKETTVEKPITWDRIKQKMNKVMQRLSIMKYLCPVHDGEKIIIKELNDLNKDIEIGYEEIYTELY